MKERTSISIFGTGSWGTALALRLASNGHAVSVWARDEALLDKIASDRENRIYLPGHKLPTNVRTQSDFNSAVAAGEFLLLAVPAMAVRSLLVRIKPQLGAFNKGLICTSKGVEKDSGLLLHEVIGEVLQDRLATAYLSGPSFALEVAAGFPTAVTVASEDAGFSAQVAALFHSNVFRVYTSDDVVGVEAGGAVKNVIAIAAGISDGLGFGMNARAALITRGLSEMRRFAMKLGAKAETMMGLAALGDLVLTCTGDQSRNRRLGKLLAEGTDVDAAQELIGQVAEGVFTAEVVCGMAAERGVEMPICEQISQIIRRRTDPRQAVSNLLSRTAKEED